MEIDGSSAFLMNKNSSTEMCFRGSLILLHGTENGIAVHCGEIDTVNEKVIKKWCSSFSQWQIILILKMNVIDPSIPLCSIKYSVRTTPFSTREN